MSVYFDLLKSPKWIKKRKRIFKRDGFKCTVCGSDKNLRAHHTYYFKKRVSPWSYPDECLITVCDSCHKNWHEYYEIEYRDNPIPGKKVKKNKPLKVKKKKIIYRCLAEIQAERLGVKS